MLTIQPLPAFNDNYIWVIEDSASDQIAVVDPGDARVVEQYLKNSSKTLSAILITHHHADHTGGVKSLVEQYKLPVYGPHHSPFKGITHPLKDGDCVKLFGSSFAVKAVPAHTLDHLAYYDSNQGLLFCGDTLFMAGCGRLFEGNAQQMQNAMDYFASLRDDTKVYCTHEYSLANLAFANAAEPENTVISSTTQHCQALRLSHQPTLPSTIALEKKINPYMRTRCESIIKNAETYSGRKLTSASEVLGVLREWKNSF